MRVPVRVCLAILMLTALVVGSPSGAGADPQAASSSPTGAVSGCDIGTPNDDFDDEVSLSSGHARVWRMYQAFFLRQPDPTGFDYWIKTRNGGATLADIAYQFASGLTPSLLTWHTTTSCAGPRTAPVVSTGLGCSKTGR
jgi:hypothetical protein